MVLLDHLKKSLPLETTEFAIARVIYDEPGFKWWVTCTICRRDHIISGFNKRISTVTHKHGVELPTSFTQDEKLDEKNGNTP